MTATAVNPYSLSTTEDIRAAATELNQNTIRSDEQHANDPPTIERTTDAGTRSISMDTMSGWQAWSFAWVRWFYVMPTLKRCPVASGTLPHLKSAYEDCCAINVERLLDQFRLEEVVHGRINTSMLRICWNMCRSHLLVASLLQLLVASAWILAIMQCLNAIMMAASATFWTGRQLTEMLSDNNETVVVGYNSTDDLTKQRQHDDDLIIYNAVGYVVIMFVVVCLKTTANSIALRTAIMLRNACAGAVFQATINSSVQSRVASHQIMVLCAEDGSAIVDLVLKGSFIVSQSLAMVLCIMVGVIMLDWAVLVATIGISFVVLLAVLMAMSSRQFDRKAQKFMHQKLGIVEEYFDGASEQEQLNLHGEFKKRFAAAVSGHFWALFKAESLRPTFSGAIAVYFLLLCIVAISAFTKSQNNSGTLVALAFLFMTALYFLMSDWSEALMAIMKGQLVLDRVQMLIGHNSFTAMPTKSDGHGESIIINNATFRWDHPLKIDTERISERTTVEKSGFKLAVESFRLPMAPSVIGITGMRQAGKTSVVHALLGHMPHRSGEFNSAGQVAYYPEKPYIIENGTLRQNICWSNVGAFDERRYMASVSTVQLNLNSGYDQQLIDRADLDEQWLQKISLARAMYNENQEIVLLENPLCDLDSDTDIADIFGEAVAQMLLMGKSVIVVSQDDNILRHCSEIHILDNGTLRSGLKYGVLAQSDAYASVKNEYKQDRLNTRNSTNMQSLQTTITISTEDLVVNQPENIDTLPSMFIWIETFYLILMNLLSVGMHVGMPLTEVIYISFIPRSEFIWYVVFVVSFIAVIILTSGLVKHYAHRIGRRFVKQMQRDVFDKVLTTAVEPSARQSQVVFVLNILLDGNFKAFQTRSLSVYNWMAIVFTITVSMLSDEYLAGVLLILFVQFIAMYYGLRHSAVAAGQLEIDSRLRLFQHVQNDIANRAVLQSTDGVLQSRNKIFNLIEVNSAAVYLQKSITFFAQFVLDITQCVGLPIVFISIHYEQYRHESSYLVTMYMFNIMLTHLYGLLDLRFTKDVADQKLVYGRKFVHIGGLKQ